MKADIAIQKVWQSLVEVEDYFQHGIARQLQNASSFGAEQALPIRHAYITHKECEPFLPSNVSKLAESCIRIAEGEFNDFLAVLQHVVGDENEMERLRRVNAHLEGAEGRYREHLLQLKATISQRNDSGKTKDYVEHFLSRLKSHPVVAIAVIVSIVMIGVANLTDAFSTIRQAVERLYTMEGLAELPGETGWIFAGYFDVASGSFIEGPYVSIVSSNRPGVRSYVEIGDQITPRVTMKVYILDFSTSGRKRNLESPILAGVISKDDETGLILSPGADLVVRDVSKGKWPKNPHAALWLRVVDKPN
jgi:hypothetical protein